MCQTNAFVWNSFILLKIKGQQWISVQYEGSKLSALNVENGNKCSVPAIGTMWLFAWMSLNVSVGQRSATRRCHEQRSSRCSARWSIFHNFSHAIRLGFVFVNRKSIDTSGLSVVAHVCITKRHRTLHASAEHIAAQHSTAQTMLQNPYSDWDWNLNSMYAAIVKHTNRIIIRAYIYIYLCINKCVYRCRG